MSHTQYGFGDDATWGAPTDWMDPRVDYSYDYDDTADEFEMLCDAHNDIADDLRTDDGRAKVSNELQWVRVSPGYKDICDLVADALAANTPEAWETMRDQILDCLARNRVDAQLSV
jgi:hypothetical protein